MESYVAKQPMADKSRPTEKLDIIPKFQLIDG